LGNAAGNPVMNYLTGGAHLERALVLKRRGGALTLVHGGMERDTAAETGLRLVDRDAQYDLMRYLQAHDGNRLAAEVAYLSDVIQQRGAARQTRRLRHDRRRRGDAAPQPAARSPV
jgi:hypothetical protein